MRNKKSLCLTAHKKRSRSRTDSVVISRISASYGIINAIPVATAP